MPEKDIAKLQRVYKCIARVVTKAPRFGLILKQLGPILASCQVFKIYTIIFRTTKDNQPAYMADLGLLVRLKWSKYLYHKFK